VRRAPKGLRLHIGIFGRRNVGKSSLLNAFTRQRVSIVSEQAGTTTDPVEKPMELLPLGPVLFIDTAGIDDEGALGAERVDRTRRAFDRSDLGLVVSDGAWGAFEDTLLAELAARGVPAVVVFNKADVGPPAPDLVARLSGEGHRVVTTAAPRGEGILDLRQALLDAAPADFLENPAILRDLVPPGEPAVLVTPIDKEAPRGRLILPQVQAIRDLLDGDAWCIVVKEDRLGEALAALARPPALVVTDSQAFREVAAATPAAVPMTSFSILFARFKGDLTSMAADAAAMDALRPGDRVLVAEACSHHPIEDDIGRVKIPRWLSRMAGGPLRFTTVQGHDFPDDLADYRLVVHCGACVQNRREVLGRVLACRRAGVPVTNYGVAIAHAFGILERALSPFPAALAAFRARRGGAGRAAS